MNDFKYRFAAQKDVYWLAEMNQQLIQDEKHKNKMTLPELEKRMSDFLSNEYTAVIVSVDGDDIGYVLYRQDPEWVYLRQLFVKMEMRRKGMGRTFMEWLKSNPWKEFKIIRVEVLFSNPDAMDFWRAIDFEDYCITMEMKNQ